MVKDFRYIAKRVIIGILIGLFFIMFKSCNVNALDYIQNVSAYIYLQSQYCEQGDTITTTTSSGSTRTGNRFSCTKGPSYKFVQLLNSDNNISVPALFSEKQLINNFTFDIKFEESQIITETNRYIVLRAPWLSSNVAEDQIGLLDSFFTLNGINNNNTITYSPSVSTYFNQPQYCSYSSNGNINKCNVYLVNDTSISRYVYYFDIPVGTSVDSITLFLGNNNIQSSYDLYTDVIVTNSTQRAMTATINSRYTTCSSSSTNYNCYSGRFSSLSSYSHNNYNIYGSHIYSGAGLIYYRYVPMNSTFTPSNRTDNLWFNSSVPSNPIIYNFSSVSTDDVNYYNNLIGGIENELNPPSDEDDIQSNITSLFSSFATNEHSQSFLTTFDALLSYPIQKMREQNSFDLVNYNVWTGTKQLDSKLCWGTDSVTGDVKNAYKVQFFRDYKFTLPCPHTDIYRHLGYGDYGFYPSNFMGAGNNGYSFSFISIWLVIQHGLLVYLLFVNVLNIYKYILDSKKSEIEVLEL